MSPTVTPFKVQQKVLFRHCDPAGIVFYPRYFEMVNDCVEAFFASIGYAFEDIHEHSGVPTVHIETTFSAPSRHGDLLDLNLSCKALGNSSLKLELNAVSGDQKRFSTQATLVHLDLAASKSAPWPTALRAALENQLEKA